MSQISFYDYGLHFLFLVFTKSIFPSFSREDSLVLAFSPVNFTMDPRLLLLFFNLIPYLESTRFHVSNRAKLSKLARLSPMLEQTNTEWLEDELNKLKTVVLTPLTRSGITDKER